MPDLTKTAVFRQQTRDCEAVRRLLADQAQHHPFGQRKPRPARLHCDSSSRFASTGRADDQRGMNKIFAEEARYLKDGACGPWAAEAVSRQEYALPSSRLPLARRLTAE